MAGDGFERGAAAWNAGGSSGMNGDVEEEVRMDDGDAPEEATAATSLAVATPNRFVEPGKDAGEGEDFYDPNDSMGTAGNPEMDDGNGPERSWRPPVTPMADYYDALEEILSEGGAQSSARYIETELHEMRLNLLMEIGRRKQAEEALGNLQNLWESMSHQLSLVGLVLPCSATIIEENKSGVSSAVDPAEDLGQQLLISQLVVESIGRGCSRAEVEMQMEPWINAKNFEITRLWDRLQYYEAANREMSQRNQEAVEMTRQQRNRRKRMQKWIWRSVGLVVALGAAAFVWSCIPSSSSSSADSKSEDGGEL